MASLRKLSVADLRRELERREKGSKKLLALHAKLSKQLATIDAELADLGVEVAPRRRPGRKPGPKPGRAPGRKAGRPAKGTDGRSRRAKNAMTLLEAILKGVPSGKTISPAEAAVAAKATGYKTASKMFGQQVANCLAKAKEFKKLGRGQYLRVGSGGKASKPVKAKQAAGKAKKPGRKPGRPKGSKAKPAGSGKAAAPEAAKGDVAA
jgi:hypothetical protein